MKANSRALTVSLLLLLTCGFVLVALFNSSASGTFSPLTVTTPTPTTIYSSTITTTTSTSTTSTSTSQTVSTTTATTPTTSTSAIFSYTSSRTITTTNVSTSSVYTDTVTVGVTSTSVISSTTSQTTTSTSTSTVTSTTFQFPSCLIATATFGSELAPEVQFLRDFRDNQILHTAAGSAFMIVFNAWYYSFSPSVAGYESTHVVEQTMMKGVLYPLVGILKLSSMTFTATSAVPELAALLSGLVASSLIGAFYLGLPLSLIRAKVRRLRGCGAQSLLERVLAAVLLGGLAIFVAAELLGIFPLLMVSSVAIILSTLFLSATFTSGTIARRLQRA